MKPRIRKTIDQREQKETGTGRGKLYFGLAVATIMILSTVGYSLLSTREGEGTRYEYGDFTFTRASGGEDWETSVDGKRLVFRYLPTEVENISCNCFGLSSGALQDSTVYFVALTSVEKQAAFEFFRNIQPSGRIQQTCLPEQSNLSDCLNLPLRDCGAASFQTKVVIFSEPVWPESNETFINYANNCLQVRGKNENLIKAVDKLLMVAFGIETV